MTANGFTLGSFKQFIIQSLNLEGITPEMIADDQPLIGGGLGLDSVDALELIVALEKHLGVKIRSHEIDRSAFESTRSLFDFVRGRVTDDVGAS